MRLRWLWRQKYRIDRGQQILALLNLALLLMQSETLKQYMGASSTAMLLIGLPSALLLVWCCGYVITLPRVQAAEDRASAETTQMRRDLDEVLRLLKRKDARFKVEFND